MRKGFTSSTRLIVLSGAILSCFAAIGARLVDLHWLEREAYVAYLTKARRQFEVQAARRGDILDDKGNRLATSCTVIELGADPQALRAADEARWPELARLLGQPLDQLQALLRRRFALPSEPPTEGVDTAAQGRPVRWVKLSEEVEESTYDRILRLGIKGVYGNRHYRRDYPNKTLAAHVLGFINQEDVAVTGVERYMDFYLHGQAGWCESERDGLRRELAQFRTRTIPPTDGYDVVLTIDSFVQHVIEAELERIATQFTPQSATIIVSDPTTGAILGLANWPTFDLNAYRTAPLDALRNLAVTDQFEPGSTFKIVAASGALNERIVTPETVFDCSLASVLVDGRPRSLPAEAHAHEFGRLTVAEIIEKSSNKGAAQLGIRLGADRLYQYARDFGFGTDTGFPFGGEVPGVLHPVPAWDGLTITRLPMGHAVSVTPLQLHCAMGVIASGGVLIRPWIIREIRPPLGRPVATYEPLPRRRVIRRAVAETMAHLLIDAASAEGTGKRAAIDGYLVAGKTGTSEKIIDGHYSHTHHVGTFLGFLPASEPRLLITVTVNDGHPPGGGIAFGGDVAAPSFKRIGEALIQYLDIPPAGAAAPRPVLAMGGEAR